MTTPGNSLNIKEVGFQSFDGVSVFHGRTLTAGTGITITNGTGVAGNPVFTASGSVPLSFNGNSGTANPAANLLTVITANSTVKFTGAAATLTEDFGLTNLILGSSSASITSAARNVALGLTNLDPLTSGTDNTAIGYNALKSVTSATLNTAVGAFSQQNITTGATSNTSIGYASLSSCTSGNLNTALGYSALTSLTTGEQNVSVGHDTLSAGSATGISYNTAIGYGAGASLTNSDSSNILIKNAGTSGDNNKIRIGTQGSGSGQQNECYIAGIVGVTNANTQTVTINSSTGQLGVLSQTPGYALSLAQSATFASPADSTTYYMAVTTWSTTVSGATNGRIWLPKGGTITAVYGSITVAGTPGSSENVTVGVRKNDTTTTNVTTSLQTTTGLCTFNNSALNISVSAGDYIHFMVITPAWATNPTTMTFVATVYIS